jgi:hypothetical protein
MRTANTFRKLVVSTLIVTTTSALVPTSAHAEMISTERAANGERDRILVLLERPDVAAQLEAYGVKPGDAKARVAALSESELARLSAEIDSAAAGAGNGGFLEFIVIGALVIVLLPFIILGALIVHEARKPHVSKHEAVDEAQSPFPR